MASSKDLPVYERPAFDWAVALAVVGIHYTVAATTGLGDISRWGDLPNAGMVYQGLLGSIGLLVAVVSAIIALLVTSDHDRIRLVRRAKGEQTVRMLFAVLTSLVVLFLAAFIALVVDPAVRELPSGPSWVRWIVEGAVVLVGLRVAKALILYRGLLVAAARPRVVGRTAEEVEGKRHRIA